MDTALWFVTSEFLKESSVERITGKIRIGFEAG